MKVKKLIRKINPMEWIKIYDDSESIGGWGCYHIQGIPQKFLDRKVKSIWTGRLEHHDIIDTTINITLEDE